MAGWASVASSQRERSCRTATFASPGRPYATHPDPGSSYLSLTQKTADTVGWASGSVPPFRCSEPQQCQAYLQCNYFTEVHNVALGSVNLSTGSLKYEQAPHCSMSTHPTPRCDESAADCCSESPRQTWGWAACT